ncbi:MAG: hypothetical protein AAFP89_23185 [Bacteroidota bacterium]
MADRKGRVRAIAQQGARQTEAKDNNSQPKTSKEAIPSQKKAILSTR